MILLTGANLVYGAGFCMESRAVEAGRGGLWEAPKGLLTIHRALFGILPKTGPEPRKGKNLFIFSFCYPHLPLCSRDAGFSWNH